MSAERRPGVGHVRSGPSSARKIVRARGRRTAELLQRRELPGEIKGVLLCMGLAAGNSLASVAMALAMRVHRPPAWMLDELHAIAIGHGTAAFVIGTLMLAVWKRTAWGYWATMILFGLGAAGSLVLAFYWFVSPAGIDFFSSPFGLAAIVILAGICLTPVLLLARARRRYFSPPPSDQRSV